MKKSQAEHSEVKIIPLANQYTELHEGLPTFKPHPVRVTPRTEYTTKFLKFGTQTRNCPIHGKSQVLDRNYNLESFTLMEGLACGHVLLISRLTKGKQFHSWRLIFKETIHAS